MMENLLGFKDWFWLVSNPQESSEESWSRDRLCAVVEEAFVEFWLESWVVHLELVDCFFEAFLPRFAFGYAFSSECAVLESESVLDRALGAFWDVFEFLLDDFVYFSSFHVLASLHFLYIVAA